MASNAGTGTDAVPFSFFASLIRKIAEIPLTNASTSKHTEDHPGRRVFGRWVNALRKDYPSMPPDTLSTLVKLLFPDADKHRIYNLKESKLVKDLESILGISKTQLGRWNREGGSGCLGRELQIAMEQTCSDLDATSPFSMAEIDSYLDELAACSLYTDRSIRSKYPSKTKRPRREILTKLFRNMPPLDAACLVQILLKDLRPLLYPQTGAHYTTDLKDHNSNARRVLGQADVMYVWDPAGELFKTSKTSGVLHQTASIYELGRSSDSPQLGTFVTLPKSVKGQSCQKALSSLHGASQIYAETKYDGERAQIHVRILADGSPEITIFSKSTRDSTLDRVAVHPIIRQALGFEDDDGPRIRENVILDAEMVAYHVDHIDEFWRIKSLVEDTAEGVRGIRKGKSKGNIDEDSQGSDGGHLALVFFDVLYLDSVSHLATPYTDRRRLLERIIQPIPHYAFLAKRTLLNVDSASASTSIYQVFADAIANHEEGLVLKAARSRYNDKYLPWVKLKRDYIPGLGDAVDMVVVGAAWTQRRANELDVSTSTCTTFYFGILQNPDTCDSEPPSFYIYFTSSYVVGRDQLESLNWAVKSQDPIAYNKDKPPTKGLSYHYDFLPLLPPPDVLLKDPILCEIVGDRFTKAPRSKYYELRFPRITKFYRPKERTWRDGVTPIDLKEIAHEVLGIDRSGKDVDDYCKDLWNVPSSPGVRSSTKRKQKQVDWVNNLRAADKLPALGMLASEHHGRSQSTASPSSVIKALFTIPEECDTPHQPLAARTNLPLPSTPTTNTHDDSAVSSSPLSPTPLSLLNPRYPTTRKRRRLDPSTPTTPIQTTCAIPTPVTSPVSPDSIQESRPLQSLGAFLLKSVIYLSDTSQPVDSPLLPLDNVFHSLDAFFLGCGWSNDPIQACAWAKQGVVVVNDRSNFDRVKQEINARRAVRRASTGIPPSHAEAALPIERKPIWLLDCQVFGSQIHNEWRKYALRLSF